MEKIRIKDHEVSPSYAYLFDTNVWLFLYGPIAGTSSGKQKVYSELLNDVTSRGATVYTTALVLSEFINRYLRIAFESWKQQQKDGSLQFKKDFRPTQEYRDQLALACFSVREILKVAEKYPDNFNATDVPRMLDRLSPACDYNDMYLVTSCEQGGFKMVSDDKDFEEVDSKVAFITA